MTPQENRDDLIKRVIDQKRIWKKGELTRKEIREAEQYVKKVILPRAYEPEKGKE